MLVGAGALGAEAEVLAVADRLGAGIAKALLGKMAVPDALPFVTGSIGLLGTQASWELMERCDTLLMVGSNFRYAGARSARDERGQADQPATRLLGALAAPAVGEGMVEGPIRKLTRTRRHRCHAIMRSAAGPANLVAPTSSAAPSRLPCALPTGRSQSPASGW